MIELKNATVMNGLRGAEYYDVKSEAVGDTFRIFVAKPMGLEPGKKYPALYILDGNAMFATSMECARGATADTITPQTYVVGIGYTGKDSDGEGVIKRNRDYTPTVGGEMEDTIRHMCDPEDMIHNGGGPAFLKFILEELKPAMEATYPIDSDDGTIGGSSLGGLFPAWVLLNHPEAFQRYILCSPAIWWEKEVVWQWEENYAAANNDLNATVFVTAGELERAENAKTQLEQMARSDSPLRELFKNNIALFEKHGYPRMCEVASELVEKIKSRNYPGLKIHWHAFPEEDHFSVIPVGINRGIRYVFGSWNP